MKTIEKTETRDEPSVHRYVKTTTDNQETTGKTNTIRIQYL